MHEAHRGTLRKRNRREIRARLIVRWWGSKPPGAAFRRAQPPLHPRRRTGHQAPTPRAPPPIRGVYHRPRNRPTNRRWPTRTAPRNSKWGSNAANPAEMLGLSPGRACANWPNRGINARSLFNIKCLKGAAVRSRASRLIENRRHISAPIRYRWRSACFSGCSCGCAGDWRGASRSAAQRRPGPRAAAPYRAGQDSPLAVLIQRSGRLPPDRRAERR
jgi:hypothetical protein